MTAQQLEERKAEKEVFAAHRAAQKWMRKERDRMGDAAYDAYRNQKMIESMESYCRDHPGVYIVKDGDGYLLKDSKASPPAQAAAV